MPDHPRPDEIDRLIHEPARLVLMAHLFVVEEADFVFLLRETGLTNGNVSSHMSRLEGAGYVAVKKSIRDRRSHTVFRLTATGRRAMRGYRDILASLLGGIR